MHPVTESGSKSRVQMSAKMNSRHKRIIDTKERDRLPEKSAGGL